MIVGPIRGSVRANSSGCMYGLVGAFVGLRDGVSKLTSSVGGMSMGAGVGSWAGSIDVYHELNDTVCSILGAPIMCSMVEIEYLAYVVPIYE